MGFERGKVGRRVAQNLSANVYNQGVSVLGQLFGVPILLGAWGTQLYGEWLILFAIPAYISMSDLGFSQSAANDMTAQVSRGEYSNALTVFQSLIALVYSVSILGLAVTPIVVSSLPLHRWLHFQAMDASTIRWVLGLFAAEVFARLPNGVNHAGFRASGENALHVGLSSTTRLLQFLAVWCVALTGHGPAAAAGAFFLVRALATPASAIFLVRRNRWLRFGIGRARRSELRRLVGPAVANLAIPLGQALNVQGMVLVVGAVLGPLAVVTFSTLRTLTRVALQVVVAVSSAAEPEIAAAYGSTDRSLMERLFLHAMRTGLWLALGAAGFLGLFGESILHVWTHGKVAMHPALFAYLLISGVASVLWYNPLTVLKAANRHLRATVVLTSSAAGTVLCAAGALAVTRQVSEAGLALLLTDTIMTAYTLRVASRLLDVSPWSMVRQGVNPIPLFRVLRGASAR